MGLAQQKEKVSLPAWVPLDRGVPKEGPLWLQARREAALTALSERGLPTAQDEEWRYTSIAPLHKFDFRPDDSGLSVLPHADTDELGISLGTGPECVFVNGRFRPKLSRRLELPAGVRIISLSEALKTSDSELEAHLARAIDLNQHPFAALNTWQLVDGAVIVLDKGVVLDAPIHLHFIANAPEGEILAQPRTIIVAGENSRATILESFVGAAGQVYLTNAVMEVCLKPASKINYYKLQNESERAFHVATLHVEQGTNSCFNACTISMGAGISRYDTDVKQSAEGAECIINGLYLAMDKQHVDHHLRLDHLQPHGSSQLLFKGVLDQQGRAVYNGKVVVHEGASGTSADQTNNNLLLSSEAEADPKPELEIYHNDVKCSHGATVGQLDEKALFYLRSRGIGLAEARQILTLGFAKQVMESIELPRLEAYCECQFLQRLGGMRHE